MSVNPVSGEYGTVFRLGVALDISTNTALSLTFTKPSGAVLTVANPSVTAPAVAAGTLNASEYLEYTWASGNLDESGTWAVRGTITFAASKRITTLQEFTVEA